MNVRLANGPVSWGVDFADAPGNPPWTRVLSEIAAAGYQWTELGPLGYMPTAPQALQAELESRGLGVAGSFVFEPLHAEEGLAEIISIVRRTCTLIAAAGGHFLVVIDLVSPERAATAGRSSAAIRLNARQWRRFCNALWRVAGVARQEFGLTPVLHPHVGTFVEFEDEIDGIVETLCPHLELCIDTGHCAYAGIDPIALFRRYRDQVSYLHLKDVEPVVHERVIREGLGFKAAIEAGVFCPLGSGMVDFEGFAAALNEAGFDGWATVEQDRDPRHPDSEALADAVRSREFLERVGLSQRSA